MVSTDINAAIEHARAIAEQYPDQYKEVFTAVLTVELSRPETPRSDLTAPSSHSQSSKQLSIQEVLRDRKPKNDVERTLVFGFYLETYKGVERFTARDIISCFRDAREQIPQNIHDKLIMNVKKGWLMIAGEKREGMQQYTLTNTGQQVAQQGFRKNKGE